MLRETEDHQDIIERVAALDIGKAEVECCVRVPDEAHPGRRLQEVTPYSTMTRSLMLLADRLVGLGVSRVVMRRRRITGSRCSICSKPRGCRCGWSTPGM